MFILVRLMCMMFWLPFRMLSAVIKGLSRGGHRHHHHRVRVAWLPGFAQLSQATRRAERAARNPGQDQLQRYVGTPLTLLGLGFAWAFMALLWVAWWSLLLIVLPIALLA